MFIMEITNFIFYFNLQIKMTYFLIHKKNPELHIKVIISEHSMHYDHKL